MSKPICRACLSDDLIRIAKTLEMPDRGVLVDAAVDIQNRVGCVHFAKDLEGFGFPAGLAFWGACGKIGDHHSACLNPEHVTCKKCLAIMRNKKVED